MYRLYGDPISGNCFKVALILHLTGRAFELVTTSVLDGDTRTPAFRAISPNGRVPVLRFPDGSCMGESNAILCALARGSAYRPADPATEDRVLEWLFFEQYSHEPNIATVRFWKTFTGIPAGSEAVLAAKEAAGRHALAVLDGALAERSFLLGEAFTIADIALYAYTHLAGEGGFALGDYPAVRAWLARVAAVPGFIAMPELFSRTPARRFTGTIAAEDAAAGASEAV